jgi:hypothetical protein
MRPHFAQEPGQALVTDEAAGEQDAPRARRVRVDRGDVGTERNHRRHGQPAADRFIADRAAVGDGGIDRLAAHDERGQRAIEHRDRPTLAQEVQVHAVQLHDGPQFPERRELRHDGQRGQREIAEQDRVEPLPVADQPPRGFEEERRHLPQARPPDVVGGRLEQFDVPPERAGGGMEFLRPGFHAAHRGRVFPRDEQHAAAWLSQAPARVPAAA